MKLTVRGSVYKAKKLRTKQHYCTTCDAYRSLRLCNEIKASLYSKKERSCQDCKVVFNSVGTLKESEDVVGELNELFLKKDRYLYSLLCNFINVVESMINELRKDNSISDRKYNILTTYISKLKLAFNIQTGEHKE